MKDYVENEHFGSMLENYYPFNYQYPVLKIREDSPLNKNIEDLKNSDAEIEIISTNSGITDKESTNYSVEESSLADIYTGVLRSYVRSHSGGSSGSGGSSTSNTPNLLDKFRSDSYFSSSDVSSTISSLGLKRPKLNDFVEGKADRTVIPEGLSEEESVDITLNEFTSEKIEKDHINVRPKISVYGADDDKETKHTLLLLFILEEGEG